MGVGQKTHKGILKRCRVTASGKVKFKRSFTGHLMSSKTGNRKRHLRRPAFVSATTAWRILAAINQ